MLFLVFISNGRLHRARKIEVCLSNKIHQDSFRETRRPLHSTGPVVSKLVEGLIVLFLLHIKGSALG